MEIGLALLFVVLLFYCVCACKINDNGRDRKRDDEAFMESISKEKSLKEHEKFLLKRFTKVN